MRPLLSVIVLVSGIAVPGWGQPKVHSVTKSQRAVAITPREPSPWKVGDGFCVKRARKKVACGKVVRLAPDRALASITWATSTILVGDEVEEGKALEADPDLQWMFKRIGTPPHPDPPSDLVWKQIFYRTFETIPSDFVEITTGPFKSPTFSLLFLGGSTALVLTDIPTTKFVQDHIEPRIHYTLPTIVSSPITTGADGWLLAGLLGHYLISSGVDHPRGQIASALALKSVMYSYLYSHLVLKTIFARHRPDPRSFSIGSVITARTASWIGCRPTTPFRPT